MRFSIINKLKEFQFLVKTHTLFFMILISFLLLIFCNFTIKNSHYLIIVSVVIFSINFIIFLFKTFKTYYTDFKYSSFVDEENNANRDKFFLKLNDNLELRYLIDSIASNIKTFLKVNGCIVYILETSDNKYYMRSDNRDNKTEIKDVFSKNNYLTILLLRYKRMVSRLELELNKDDRLSSFVSKLMLSYGVEICTPIVFNNILLGFIFLSNKKNHSKFTDIDFNILKFINLEISLTLNASISYTDLKRNYLQTIDSLVITIEAKGENTKGHSERVQYLAIEIAKELKCSRKEIETLRSASILHDIGKIGVENKILTKDSPLTDEEYEKIKEHSVIGEEIIAPIDFFEDIKHIIRQHHERWDGKGYPDGLHGKKISLLSRILNVADSFDAMTHDKTYRKSKSIREAIVELKRGNGTQFDPSIIKALEKLFQGSVY